MSIGVEERLHDEISTRNCKHCIANTYIHCDEGHPLLGIGGRPYRYDEVINKDYLLWPCRGCLDFEKQF